MSLNLNRVLIAGRLTRDVELRQAGTSKAGSMALAINRTYKDGAGEKKEEATFVDIDLWGKTAELCAQYLQKGSCVFVEGRLKLDVWKTKDGQPRQSIKVVAENVQFLTPPKSQAESFTAPVRTYTAPVDTDEEPF